MEQYDYNGRQQTTALRLGTEASASSVMALGWTFGSGAANNGNVAGATISGQGLTAPVSQSFGYDTMNRLSSASEGSTWSRTFKSDRFGNTWLDTTSGGTVLSGTPRAASDFNTATNQYKPSSGVNDFDTSGNMTKFGSVLMEYDFENRLTKTTVNGSVTTHVYDGEGRRVKKVLPNRTETFVYDVFGSLAAEYGSVAAAPSPQYVTTDYLGHVRAVTDGAVSPAVVARRDYYPFGEPIPNGLGGRDGKFSAAWGTTMGFGGKERDGETATSASAGLDYFGARYYGSTMYRFGSPDEPLVDQHVGDPGSWNLYGFVRSNPLRFVDPSGLACVYVGPEGSTSRKDLDDPGNYRDIGTEGQSCQDAFANNPGKPRLNSEQEAVFSFVFKGFFGLLMDPPGVGDDSRPPTHDQFFANLGPPILKVPGQPGSPIRLLEERPPFSRTPGGFVNWLTELGKKGKVLSKAEADAVIQEAKNLGVPVRLDPPHPNTNWNRPHLNVGKEGKAHIEVVAGYDNPTVAKGTGSKPR